MSKILLKETEPEICRWFCESCGKKIDYVPENLFSVPLINSCPHCGVIFDGYELCERRKQTQRQIEDMLAKIKREYSK